VWGPAAPVREGKAGVSSNLGIVPGGGATDRWVRPVSGTREREPRAQARVGPPEKETEWPSSDEQYGFSFI
jgi:hypothetical protein